MKWFGAIILTIPLTLCGADYYVAGAGSDANDGLTPDTPFRTIQKAADLTQPGDVVNVMDGEYVNPCDGCSVVDITRSGGPDAWIIYRAYPGAKPRLRFNGWNGFSVHRGASYIEISGFEVQGGRADVTFDYCRAEKGNNNPLCNTNGINVDGRDTEEQKPHHIRIAGNHVWQCPGGGIAAMQADYVTVEDNVVHENAWYSRFANSGISLYQAWNSDDSSDTKIVVRRNRSYNNRSMVEWMATGRLSDGNGIIIDDFRNTQNASKGGVYQGRTRVENNLSYDNGGGGVVCYSSDHVDIVNNTTYKNGQVVGYPEVFVNSASDIRVVNNVLWARRGVGLTKVLDSAGVTVDFNLYVDSGDQAPPGPNDIWADPLLVNASTDPVRNDFHLLLGSPAIRTGDASLAPEDDIEGRPRTNEGGATRGAYEAPASEQGATALTVMNRSRARK
jgi:hypothetical protein